MGSELQSVLIDEAVELIIDHRGRTPKKLGGDFSSSGVQVVSAKHVYDGRLHLDRNRRFVQPEMAKRWMPMKLRQGDVLLTSEAPLGEVAYLSVDTDICLGQRLFALRARSAVADGRFLYYTLRSPLVQSRLYARATGTTAQGIKQSELRKVALEMPPVAEQARIAAVLGTLDDRIDSNRRLVALLEETAATVFRARFVDFVGVDDFEETEIGRIPAGWNSGLVADLAVIAKESVAPSAFPDAQYEHFSIPAFDDGQRPNITAGEAMLSSKTAIPDGDCVLISKLNPATRRVWWPTPGSVGRPVCSPEFIVLSPRAGIPNSYLYSLLVADDRLYSELLSHVAGTTGSRQRIRPADLMSCRALIPDAAALQDWDEVIRPLLDWRHVLLAESWSLAFLRDALLPDLISGKIRVGDPEGTEKAYGPPADEFDGVPA